MDHLRQPGHQAASRRSSQHPAGSGPGARRRPARPAADRRLRPGRPDRGARPDRQEETGQGRVNWLGLQLVEDTRWMVLPMGAGLADGYLGMALFLAQLAELTGVDRYAEVARRAVSAIPQLLDALAAQPGLPGVVGCGAAEGLGGISYGLARLATLLHDIEFRDLATMAIQLATTAFSAPGPPWWTSGVAGCLAAMTATAAELESAAAASLAVRCADHLAGLVERTDGRCVPDGDPVPPGFAGGPAGVGWALWRFAPPGAPSRYFRAAQCAVRQAVGPAAGTATGSDAEQVY